MEERAFSPPPCPVTAEQAWKKSGVCFMLRLRGHKNTGSRRKFGQQKSALPSYFLNEIDMMYLDLPPSDAREPAPRFDGFEVNQPVKSSSVRAVSRVSRTPAPTKPDQGFVADDPRHFKEGGYPILHERFGRGTIASIESELLWTMPKR